MSVEAASDASSVGVALGLAQYWSSLAGAFGVGLLIYLVKNWSDDIKATAKALAAHLEARASHLDECIDGLRTDVQKHHDDTSNRLSILETWRTLRDELSRMQADEWKDYRHHMLEERETDRRAAHELRNIVNALGLKIATLERREK